jgi:hypothetical protein
MLHSPDYFIHDGKTYECVGNDEGKFWTSINGAESIGFEQGNCIPLYYNSAIHLFYAESNKGTGAIPTPTGDVREVAGKAYSMEDVIEFAMSMLGQYVHGNMNIWNREILKESLNSLPDQQGKKVGGYSVEDMERAFKAGQHYGYSSTDRSSACTAPDKETFINSLKK